MNTRLKTHWKVLKQDSTTKTELAANIISSIAFITLLHHPGSDLYLPER